MCGQRDPPSRSVFPAALVTLCIAEPGREPELLLFQRQVEEHLHPFSAQLSFHSILILIGLRSWRLAATEQNLLRFNHASDSSSPLLPSSSSSFSSFLRSFGLRNRCALCGLFYSTYGYRLRLSYSVHPTKR